MNRYLMFLVAFLIGCLIAQIIGDGFTIGAQDDFSCNDVNDHSLNCFKATYNDAWLFIKNAKDFSKSDLELANNNPNFTFIPEGLFTGFTSLNILDLSYNNIINISVGAFDGLTSLETLNLSYNNIINIPDDLFNGLTNLKILDLHNNKITNIPDDLFTGLTKLKRLNLSYNNITNIKPISKLTKLKKLDLNNNKIKNIKPISGLTALETLDLSGNKIKNIKPIRGLTALETLDLSFNKITNIKLIGKLTSLRILTLSNNKITNIDQISKLIKLYTLNLDGNQITTIEPIRGLTSLIILNLSYNDLSKVTWDVLDNIPVTDFSIVQCNLNSIPIFNNLNEVTYLNISNEDNQPNDDDDWPNQNNFKDQELQKLNNYTGLERFTMGNLGLSDYTDFRFLNLMLNLKELDLTNYDDVTNLNNLTRIPEEVLQLILLDDDGGLIMPKTLRCNMNGDFLEDFESNDNYRFDYEGVLDYFSECTSTPTPAPAEECPESIPGSICCNPNLTGLNEQFCPGRLVDGVKTTQRCPDCGTSSCKCPPF